MRRTRAYLVAAALAAGLAAGCSQAELAAPPTCAGQLAPGDLSITEVMPNPAGADTGKEWFEVKNNRATAADLGGLVLSASKLDGTGEHTHAVTAQTVVAGGYVVFGNGTASYVSYSYGGDLGLLDDDGGRITLRCGEAIIAQITYSHPTEGVARAYDGKTWCDATDEYEPGDKGSPGVANASCGGSGSTCDDGGTARPIVSPVAGDVVISEIMPDPHQVSDAKGEWFELTLLRDVDLNGLQIGTSAGMAALTIDDSACRRRTAGSQVVFGRTADPAENGGLPALEGTFSFGLPNGGGMLWVGIGGVTLDQVSWTSSHDGASLSLDPGSLDPIANDDERNFCAGQSSYGDGDLGTPGAPNDRCGPIDPGQCFDGDVMRPVRAPAAGDLVINEILADPTGPDTGKEWFEVYVAKDVDLNGLELGATFPTVIQRLDSATCLAAKAGSYLVFAHNDGSSPDGGLPREDYRFSFDLVNSNRGLFLGRGGALIDAITYGTTSEGLARSLDPRRLDATSNDDQGAWCDTVAVPYGDGTNKGTPGSPNGFCPNGPGCRDGDVTRDVVSPAPGDVVITEVMPDPAAAGDEEGEWFELKLNKDVDLNGLQLGTTPGSPKLTISDGNCRRRSAGSRLVFARSADATQNGGLPKVEDTFGFGLTNSGGSLYVGVGGQVLDQVSWSGSSSGVSRSLDPGSETPSANDDENAWCGAVSRYGDGDRGTPGAANDVCPPVVPTGMCLDGSTPRNVVPPQPGDLVITEVLPNPTGTDTGKEWFEVYVEKDVDLNGLELGATYPTVLQTNDDPLCHPVKAGQYLIFAHNDLTQDSGGLPRIDLPFTFSLVNADRGVFLGYGGTLIDAVTYGSVQEGVARSLDPGSLDATQNDDDTAWCDAQTTYGAGDKGTPGAANPACPIPVPPGMCRDGMTVRNLVAPSPGRLVITEIMPNPAAVPDTDGEWFEVTSTHDLDLNGLQIGRGLSDLLVTLTSNDCLAVHAGSPVIFARSADPSVNGGLPPVEATFPFSLPNSNGSLLIAYNGVTIDRVLWDSSRSGRALNLDPDAIDPSQNNDASNWCDATRPYGDGDYGTPALANDQCPVVVPAGKCLDGHDLLRNIRVPAPGDLVISEIMQDPTAVLDTAGEWFEVTVMRDVDLNGLELGTDPGTPQATIVDDHCRARSAGSRLLFARSADPAVNGGLPQPVEATFGFSLSNSVGSLYVGAGGQVVDQVAWSATTPGQARSLDKDKIDATANDDDASWCPATTPYGTDGDQGTPAAENPACPIVVPDGMCLDPDMTLRSIQYPGPSDLAITEVMADPSAVSDAAGEWFEVTLLADVDVNGLEAGVTPGSPQMRISDTACRPRTAGSRLVFAHGTDPMTNGGLPALEATFGFGLTNTSGSLYVGAQGATLDAVTWSVAPSGASLSLDPAHTSATENDDPANWCPSAVPYGDGDLGTPGAANESCPIVIPPGQCLDGATVRPIVPPQAGDVVISEVMPNPIGDETTREWFEVTLLADADLVGLEIGKTPGTVLATLAGDDCRHHVTGDAIVLARPPTDTGDNGGLPPVEGTFNFSLANTGGSLFIGSGGALLDQVTWSSSVDGESRSLDPGKLDPDVNDLDASWCLSTTSYGSGGAGTPGAANEICVPDGMCIDNGALRPINTAQPGDVVVSEIMAGQTDPDRDWFEVALLADIDLNGLAVGPSAGQASFTFADRACLPATTGTALVFAHSADAGANGGLPAPDAVVAFPLDASGTIWVGAGATTLDSVSWSAVTEGVARNLDPDSYDPAANDLDASWCPATQAFGDGGLGSPGADNEQCPVVQPMCLDADGMTMRPPVTPQVGDLLITEIMNNAIGTSELGKEWFEVLVQKDVDLVGLSVASGTHSIAFSTTDCQRVTKDTFLLFANGDAATSMLPRVDYQFDFALLNSASSVSVLVDGQLLDLAAWGSNSGDGVSRTLKKSTFDTVSNDTSANFCNTSVDLTYGDGTQRGTPGEDDPTCL